MSVAQNKMSKKKQKNLRSVLMCGRTYWPAASDCDSLLINDKLRSCLAPARINVPRVPWYLLRSLPKEERKKKQEEMLNLQPPDLIQSYYKALELRKCLFLGVNSLCKGIEEKKVAACILDAEVSPKILVSHLAQLARNLNIPVLAVQHLKDTLKDGIGFSSLALGFQKSVEEDVTNEFHETCLFIIKMSKSLESSEKQQSSTEEKTRFESVTTDFIGKDEEKINLTVNNFVESIFPEKNMNCIQQNLPDLLDNVYLYRKSKETRVFKPLGNDVVPQFTIAEDITNDNIQLTPTEEVVKKVPRNERYFKRLIVKRVQSNPNKKRKKNKKKKL